jgi:hypothetical protein
MAIRGNFQSAMDGRDFISGDGRGISGLEEMTAGPGVS